MLFNALYILLTCLSGKLHRNLTCPRLFQLASSNQASVNFKLCVRPEARQRFLARLLCGPYNRLKNQLAAVNAIRIATRILLEEGEGLIPNVFFAQKQFNLGPALTKLMLLKHITEGGRAPGCLVILQQKIAIITLFQSLFAGF